MELVTAEEFASRTSHYARRAPPESPIQHAGTPFRCACGEVHAFCPEETEHLPHTPIIAASTDWFEAVIEALIPLPLFTKRLVVQCPVSEAATCVRLQGTLNPRIRSEFGTTERPAPSG